MNLPLQLDRGAAASLQDQLFEQLRQLILTGKLKPNTRVIATRFLAEQVGVSRRTVLFAYERLIAEGYLETRPAIGTFVCARPPRQSKPEAAGNSPSDIPRQSSLHPASFRTLPAPRPRIADSIIDFSPALVDASHLLPSKVWLQGMRNVFADDPEGLAKSQPAAGVTSLRQLIVDYLAATRGLVASPEQVVIVTGRRHACSLVAHLFQRRGDRVVVESPGDEAVAGFFKTRHAEVIAVPVDEHGLETDALPQSPISLAYVTPVRQNPLGGTMPPSRRMALIEWARAIGAYLIEDDCDSEFRYHGTAQQPLAALDPYGLVFYTGSFAKTLGAGLGLGYLVVPGEFADAIVAIKAMAEDGCQWLEQMVVSNLLSSGEYDHHLRRVRRIYLERRDCLIRALERHFGQVHLIGTEIGTQLTWLMPDHFPPAPTLREAAWSRGVNIEGVAGACRYRDKALIFGYAGLAPEKLRQGIAALADAVGEASALASAQYDRT
jgi:GntR family transcriptional regulator/MocR family aminotransferase